MSDVDTSKPVIVILRALALGDLLTAIPALRAVRRVYPGYTCYLTSPTWLRPLVEYAGVADICLDAAVSEDGRTWRTDDPRSRIALEQAQLRCLVGAPACPAVAINLRGVRAATHEALLRLHPRRYIGFSNKAVPGAANGPCWDPDEHEVSRWCRLLSETGIAADPADLSITPPGHDLARSLAGCSVVHPGAGSPAREWPIERWVAVVRTLREHGHRVVITGDAAERVMARRLAERAGIDPAHVLAGRLPVLATLAVIGAARLLVSTDTGVAHMAYATSTPSVTLYGPMPPSRWGPPTRRRHRVVWLGARGEPYGPATDPTIERIGVETVLAAIAEVERANLFRT